MSAKPPSIIMGERHAEDRRHRLALALERLDLNAKEASQMAGLNAGYVTDFLNKRSQSKDQLLKILCDKLGIRWEWFDCQIPESAPMLKSELPAEERLSLALRDKQASLPRKQREMFLFILETVVEYLKPELSKPDARAFASILRTILLDILEEPQEQGDRDEERIRTVVSGVLRAILHK